MLPPLVSRISHIFQPENLTLGGPPNGPSPDDGRESTSSRASTDPFEGLEAEPEPRAPTPSNSVDEAEKKKPALPTKSANDPNIEEVEFLRGIGREAQVWTTYVKETKEFDDDMVDGWNKSLDVTLLFAALFSAILTAFALESAKQLEPDKADQTMAILREISRALQTNGAQNALIDHSDSSSDAEFHPKRHAIWVNCLWFLSLSLSIAVALAAMLAKQWCYYYLSARSGDTITQAEERQKRYGGLAYWRMRGILEHLPMLMHIALALFSVGMILYLWDINIAVASTVSAVSISALCFYLGTIFLPVYDKFCPFKTTQSVYARFFLDHIARWLGAQERRAGDPQTPTSPQRNYQLKVQALLKMLLSPFQAIKVWAASQISRPRATQERPTAMRSHIIEVPPPTSSNEDAQSFIKDALEWLIFNSQKSASIDTAIGALAIGKVPFNNDDLKHRVNLHLVKHFSDCFIIDREGGKLQLSHHQRGLNLALDYVNWMTYFAGDHPSQLAERVLEFNNSLGAELWTRLGLAFASLADQREISADVGKKVAFWLSSFIICYAERDLYLSEEVLSTLIDGLTISGRNVVASTPEERARILAIPHLINILWRISEVDGSVLRSSIGLNLAVFALTTDLPYSINKQGFKSAAEYLAYDYRSHKDRDKSFTSFVVFALLGFVHPKSKLELPPEDLGTVTRIIMKRGTFPDQVFQLSFPNWSNPVCSDDA
ncbi:hypothetical protein FRC08_005137 [Ceratobasidium sp. 394]|nr:hypothetical protein FRC08_005137 [Ceratobasidium sp. 394]